MMLHWSTCNANLQCRFATHVFCTNLQTCYTFESLSKTSNALQHCKYRKKSFATGRYTRMIFRATSYHCKLALQVDQCNITFMTFRVRGVRLLWVTDVSTTCAVVIFTVNGQEIFRQRRDDFQQNKQGAVALKRSCPISAPTQRSWHEW